MKFYELSIAQRWAWLARLKGWNPEELTQFQKQQVLKPEQLTALIENTLTQFPLPEGLVPEVRVNRHDYCLPYVTEEPSVTAAAANGAKRVMNQDGILAEVLPRFIIGQVIVAGVSDWNRFEQNVRQVLPELMRCAEQAHPSAVARGGGLKKIEVLATTATMGWLKLSIDAGEAMGANLANTICEAIAHYITAHVLVTGRVLAAILSNDGSQQLVQLSAQAPFSALTGKDGTSGAQIAEKMALLSDFAYHNQERALTNLKGMLNGMTAVTVATGNDERALATAVMGYACQSGEPKPLFKLTCNQAAQCLQIEGMVPVVCGTVGGATRFLPQAAMNLAILGHPSTQELMMLIASAGLINLVAAHRALVSTGIQAGHMPLQQQRLIAQLTSNSKQQHRLRIWLSQHPQAGEQELRTFWQKSEQE